MALNITGDAQEGGSSRTDKFLGKDMSFETAVNLLLSTSDVNDTKQSGKAEGDAIVFEDDVGYGLAISKGALAASGWEFLRNIPIVTSAVLVDVAEDINLPANGKKEGFMVIEDLGSTYRLMVSTGALATSPWEPADGSAQTVVFAGQVTTGGGAAAEADTITGLLATDLAIVQIVSGTAIYCSSACTTDTLTNTFNANPSTDTVYNYMILRDTQVQPA